MLSRGLLSLLLIAALFPTAALAQAQSNPEPFAWGDFTWLNDGSRQTSRLLDNKYFTPQIDVDSNYTFSFNQPIDNTIVGSTATARHNELSLAFLGRAAMRISAMSARGSFFNTARVRP